MIKITIQATVVAGALCCLGFGIPSFAGQKLDEINAKLDQQALEIDQKYGVLIDYQERGDLKLDLIAQQALSEAADGTQSVKDIAEAAFATYEITDPYEQRKLLIKMESQATQKGTGQGGTGPEFP